jgi:hypothetical protein
VSFIAREKPATCCTGLTARRSFPESGSVIGGYCLRRQLSFHLAEHAPGRIRHSQSLLQEGTAVIGEIDNLYPE